MNLVLATGHVLHYNLGQIVYLKTDPEQIPRMITNIKLNMDLGVLYYVSKGEQYSSHYAGELSAEKDWKV